MFTRSYYYGESNNHVVRLTPAEADAVNTLRLIDAGNGYYHTNLSPRQMKIYNRAADKLNAYLETHGTVEASEEYLAENDVLRPVQ